MNARRGLCEECQELEMHRSFACYAQEKIAKTTGQPYECTCAPVPCDLAPPPHVRATTSAPPPVKP